jgi:hypothetical protein
MRSLSVQEASPAVNLTLQAMHRSGLGRQLWVAERQSCPPRAAWMSINEACGCHGVSRAIEKGQRRNRAGRCAD